MPYETEILVLILLAIIVFIVITLEKINKIKHTNSIKRKGENGEYYIKTILGETVPGQKYVINNLTIKDTNNKTSQIDHIIINKNGVFVIETKNYSGRIYGKETQLEWTQVLNYGNQKHHFYNPVKQNATHIYKLKEITKTVLPIKSVVVFIQGNIEYIESNNVYTPYGMERLIETPVEKEITINQMENLYNQILEIQNLNIISETDHIKTIKQTMKETEEGKCPRCGAKLKERIGQYGTFYGCTNYPKCKFTKR